MVAITLPAFAQQFLDWVQLNPALGAVVILLAVVFLLWLVRKSLKFFMVALILLGVTILGSYYHYGPARTNEAVKRGSEDVLEQGKAFIDKRIRDWEQADKEADSEAESLTEDPPAAESEPAGI